MEYRREVDGLRALAVVPVILFHAGFTIFSGGFVGVDIFFVISGYLITTILITEITNNSFTYLNFWERRVRRILPALIFVLLASIVGGWISLLPEDFRNFSSSIGATLLFLSNHFFANQSSYFDTSVELKPLIHTWSLSLEEQYYLIFPLFLKSIWKFKKYYIIAIITIIFLFSLTIAEWGSFTSSTRNFYLLPSRIWEFFVGSFVAFYFSSNIKKPTNTLLCNFGSSLGLIFIIYSILIFNKTTPSPGLHTLIPTLGTALFIVFCTPSTFAIKIIGHKLLVRLGLISYSAYLWHQPLLAFYRQLFPSNGKYLLLILILNIILAHITFKYIETPFRNKKYSGLLILKISVFFSLLIALIAFIIYKNNGFESRLTTEQNNMLKYTTPKYTANLYEINYKNKVCLLEPSQNYLDFQKICQMEEGSDSVFIWGDSHAAALSFGLRAIYPSLSQFNASGCPPLKDIYINQRGNCLGINEFIINKIISEKPKIIIIHANWSLYKNYNIITNLEKTIKFLKSSSPLSDIIIIGSVPQWQPSLPVLLVRENILLNNEIYLKNNAYDELQLLDNTLKILAKTLNVKFISILDTICIAENCLATVFYNDTWTPTTWDYGHLTSAGSKALATKIFQDKLL
jgi:peptidoglycan/LPS O-acetylase OafA/YrhL